MRHRCLILLSMLGALGCGSRLHAGDQLGGGGHAGSSGGQAGSGGGQAGAGGGQAGAAGGQAGAAAGAAGSIMPSGAAGAGGAPVDNALSVDPSSATFAGTLVEAMSASQTFTVRNQGTASAGTTSALAALAGTNAADFLITSNACGATLQPGQSCAIAIAFAPKTRSGSRSARLEVGASSGGANVSLSGTALPSLGLLAGGLGGFGTADGRGPNARFFFPAGVASDGAGNFYVTSGSTIRKIVIATGDVTTFAGVPDQNGEADGTGANALFNGPGGVASDGAGNLFVSDSSNHTIRKIVIATREVTTLAGAPTLQGNADGTGLGARFQYPGSIALDGAGNLYVTSGGTIRKIVIATAEVTTFAGDGGYGASVDGTGTSARFNGTAGMANDGAGNLYVADIGSRAIRKIVIATRAVTTFQGTDARTGVAAGFVGPTGIASDGAGNLYVADENTIRKIVLSTGVVTTVTGTAGQAGSADGKGAAARFDRPSALAGDGAGNFYVVDQENNTIRKVAVSTGAVTTIAGAPMQSGTTDGLGAAARFRGPWGVLGDGAASLYVADLGNSSIRKVDLATRTVTTLTPHLFNGPLGFASDGKGALYVADGNNIRTFDIATGTVTMIAGTDGEPGNSDGTGMVARFNEATGITGGGAGDFYIADSRNNAIRKLVAATGAVTTFAGSAGTGSDDGPGPNALFNHPLGIAGDGAGNLYVADTDNRTIRKVVIATGAVTTLAGAPGETGGADGVGANARFNEPRSLAADGAGNVYVVDGSTIRKIVVASAAVSTVIGSPGQVGASLGALPASLNLPYGVAVLPTGELIIVELRENAILIAHL
jgi:hypothetical protein